MAEWLDFDLEFHSAVTRAADNRILELAMIAVHMSRPTTNNIYVDSLDRQQVWEQHDRIANAIADGDPDAAQAALHAHVDYLRTVRDGVLDELELDDVVISELSPIDSRPGTATLDD
jgi:GntR family transcriptional repressor for pyruvate dehydrogenase complex